MKTRYAIRVKDQWWVGYNLHLCGELQQARRFEFYTIAVLFAFSLDLGAEEFEVKPI